MTTTSAPSIEDRVEALDWTDFKGRLDSRGFAITDQLLDGGECAGFVDLFDGGQFRSTVDMARHRFGDGRYRYFDHPLPPTIADLRASFYSRLAPIANEWSDEERDLGPTERTPRPTKS